MFRSFRSSRHCGRFCGARSETPLTSVSGKTGSARLLVSPLQHSWAGRSCTSMVMTSSRTSSSCCFPSCFPASSYLLSLRRWFTFGLYPPFRLPLAESHHGLRTRRGVLPPCARDPTFHPRTLPLRSPGRFLCVPTRSGRISLLGRRHRSRCHPLLADLALLRFIAVYICQPVGRASRRRTAHGQDSHFLALFFFQVQAFRWT